MGRREELDARIAELEAQQANGDDSRLTQLRLTGFLVLRESWKNDR